MKQDVVLPKQSKLIMGKDVSFLHGYQNAGDHSCLENLAYYLANFLVNSEIRSPNLGTAAIALSKYVLGMVYCGAGARAQREWFREGSGRIC